MQIYSIKVDVHEARDVVYFDPSKTTEAIPHLYVKVVACGTYQETTVNPESSNSIFKSSFHFNASLNKKEFDRNRIIFEVYHSYQLFGSELIGVHAFGFPLVYAKPQHYIHRTWVPIISPKHPSKNKGFLLVSVGIFGPGDPVPVFKDNQNVPEADRVRREFILKPTFYVLNINVHRGEDIKFASTSSIEPSVRVHFGGMEATTSKILGNPNPEWQTGIYIPCLTPNYDGLVTVDILNRDSELIHSQKIHFAELLKKPIQGKWLNIYYGPSNTSFFSSITGSIDPNKIETDYGGRILISGSLTQVQVLPTLGTRPCKAIPDPYGDQYAVWAEIYEAIPLNMSNDKIRIACSFGPHTIYSNLLEMTSEKNYMVNEESGGLDEIIALLPHSCYNPWDVFLYCVIPNDPYSLNNLTRTAWLRIPFDDVIDSEFRPKWYQLSSFIKGESDKLSILISITLKKYSSHNKKPQRLGYNISKFIFRAMIYEALRLPVYSESYPNPYVQVELGRYTIQTNISRNTINPTYYQSFELEVILPENKYLAPDIKLQIFNDTASGSDSLLCTGTFPVDRVPYEWSEAPKWVDMKTNGLYSTSPKLLVAFELLPLDIYEKDPEKFEFFDDIHPTVYPSLVSLLVIGIRMFQPIENPHVLVSFGQRYGVQEDSGMPSSGNGSNWNFLRNFDFEIDLPKRMQHHVQLQFTVFNSDNRVGSAQVIVNPLLPWLNTEEKEECSEMFKEHENANQGMNENKNKNLNNTLPLPPDDYDCLNVRFGESIEHVCLEKKEIDKRRSELTSFNTMRTMVPESDDQAAGSETNPPPLNNSLDFDLEVEDFRGMEREEIPYEYECNIIDEELPYFTTPIYKHTISGSREVIGYFKYYCTIVRLAESVNSINNKTASKRKEKERIKMENKREDLLSFYEKASDLVIRAYILGAKGLVSPSGTKDIASYIWLRCGDSDDNNSNEEGLPKSIRDTSNIKNQGFNPEFNGSFKLGCALPDDALLRISVMDKGSLTDEVIGTTMIDIEDRYFSKIVTQLLEQDTIPVESRSLKLEGSSVSHGTLLGWYEIMDAAQSRQRPLKALTSYETQEYELRVVIWGVRNVISKDSNSISMFVRGVYQSENDLIEQDTDVHYNSIDGSGKFNWRFIYGIKIPTEYTILNLQIRSYAMIQSAETICQASYDLSSAFQKARKGSGTHYIPKTWIDCTHPSFGTQLRGQIEIEASIITQADAQIYPVGDGRNEPNKDPYLPAVLENREYINWKGITESIGYATNAIMSGLKWTGAWVVAAAVIAAVLFIIVLIK